MDGTISLTDVEACEAVRAYLVLRGAMPAHGKVRKVKQSGSSYTTTIDAEIEIGEPPVIAPAPTKPEGGEVAR